MIGDFIKYVDSIDDLNTHLFLARSISKTLKELTGNLFEYVLSQLNGESNSDLETSNDGELYLEQQESYSIFSCSSSVAPSVNQVMK